MDQSRHGIGGHTIPVHKSLIAAQDALLLAGCNGLIHLFTGHTAHSCKLVSGHGAVLLQQFQKLLHG